MSNAQVLKQLLKEPLEDREEFKDFQERTYQFLLGIYDAGRIVGFKEGRSLELIIAALNEFGSNTRSENDHWGDYATEENVRDWMKGRLTEPVQEFPKDVP